MKKLLLCFILLSSPCSYAQTKKILSDQDKLNDCIAAHTTYFTFNDDRPTGKGWQILEGLFAQNQFVAWGEYHNSPKLSKLTAYAMVSAAKQGYKTLCVETSPFVATELMRISRTRNPSDTLEKIYKEGYPGIGTLPFFHTKEDAQMLVTAKNAGYTIWGIDQEFQMCFSYGISKVYHAQSEKVKAKFRTVYDSLLSRWWYPDTKLLDSLQRAVSQKNLRAVLDDIKISKEIYRYGDNEGRASLMKKNFFNYFDQSQQDKVFFKMGSNHLAKGINLETNLYDIGNALYELAERNGTRFTNVYMMVRYTTEQGAIIDDLNSNENQYPKVFTTLYESDKWVLVDIHSLRTRLRNDGSLTRDAYAVLEKYDYVLISPEVMK